MIARRTLLVGLIATALPARAHHSYDFNYDGTRLLTLAGSVKLFSLENPLSRIVIDVRNAAGAAETWTVETVPASRAAQMNHPLQSVALKPGDAVTVIGWPAKDNFKGDNGKSDIGKRMGGHKLILADGRQITLRPSLTLPAKRD